MKTKTLLLLFFFSFACLTFAQQNNNLFDYDFAQFEYDSVSNYLELYYSFNQSALTIASDGSTNYVEGVLGVSLVDTVTGKAVVDKQWKLKYPITDTSATANKSLVGLLPFAIPGGIYKCTVSVTDKNNPANKKELSDIIKVHPFAEDTLAVSDVQLASRILQNSQNKNSIFYKNTFEVTPQPTLVFGENLPVVFYYFEVYEKTSPENKDKLLLNTMVINSKGKVYYNRNLDLRRGIPSRVEVGSLPINKYPTDSYIMRISLIYSAASKGMSTTKRFFVYNPGVKVVDTSAVTASPVLSSVFGVMSLEECDDLFAKSKYIATSNEIDQYSKLSTVAAKRDFLYKFWKKRDPDPATPQNSYFQDYLKRIQEANRKYGSFNRQGWKTDRGRVLITYGEPSEIDRYPNQIDTKPYEIWRYNDIEGGVIFVFADLTGYSDYQLVNSTKRGEMEDDNWMSRIATN